MSETLSTDEGTQPAPDGADALQQPDENELPPTGTEEAEPETPKEQPEPEPEPNPEEEYRKRTAQLAFEAREARRQARAAAEELDRLRAITQDQTPREMTPADIDRLANERAQQIVHQRELEARVTAWDAAGQKEFPDFRERCAIVADLVDDRRQDIVEIVTSMDDGHRVVAYLADHPDETLKLAKLPPVQLAVALAKLNAAPMPKPVSSAPPPIRPVQASATVELTPENMSEDQFQKWWNKRTKGH
jgi:hypothetical protein